MSGCAVNRGRAAAVFVVLRLSVCSVIEFHQCELHRNKTADIPVRKAGEAKSQATVRSTKTV